MLKRFLKRVLVFSLFAASTSFFTIIQSASPYLQESVTQQTYYIDARDVDSVELLKKIDVLLAAIQNNRKKIFPPNSTSLEDPEKPALPLIPWYYYCNVRSLQQQTDKQTNKTLHQEQLPFACAHCHKSYDIKGSLYKHLDRHPLCNRLHIRTRKRIIKKSKSKNPKY